jgi:putrescine:ornithine antiporter
MRIRSCAIAALAVVSTVLTMPLAAGTADHIKQTGRIRLGYRTDARPFSYRDESGNPAGYSTTLCQRIAETAKADLGLSDLKIEWVPVTLDSRLVALREDKIDLLCGADSVTLSRRSEVAFSIPIFPGGIGALLRADAPARLREALAGRPVPLRPVWRGTVDPGLQARTSSVVAGTTSEKWLTGRLVDLEIPGNVVRVNDYDAGVRSVLDRSSNIFFGDRAILLDAAKRSPAARDLIVLDRQFTHEPVSLALPRGDEELRLIVDRTLSRLYRTGDIGSLYTKWFGEPDESALAFFRMNALPD